ncbi:hypothetical protein MpV1_022c [Micromonas sp. RCC1109 virus MpV1]|uniref:hypothetical protein n=1 Tax=Micromonas sp. RCC1109 virus MpV1 TaxID=880161 RepID=UPI0001EF4432|nr:hypothetical protein MpV1_022c [Micromonas sp. RCC1109 virus MpV1]ADQ90945.1 hypothetical protein MpV1_022c [Micromonas sp. RCC1109 virus MpV1]
MINKILLGFAIAFVIAWMVFRSQEKYQAGRMDYRYGFIDTNPARRVSDAFDSPDQKNVYEGLPLP